MYFVKKKKEFVLFLNVNFDNKQDVYQEWVKRFISIYDIRST